MASPPLKDANNATFQVLAPQVTTLDTAALPGGVANAVLEMTELVETTGTAATRVGLKAALTAITTALHDGSNVVAPSSAGDVAGTLTNGRAVTTTAGTPVAIRGTSLTCKWVTVTALTTNTQQINIGGTGVSAVAGSSTGIPLDGGISVTIPVNDVAKVFVDSRVNGEGVSWVAGA